MTLIIHGIGTATPEFGVSQQEATEIAQTICCDNERQHRSIRALYRRAGVRFRHSVALESADAELPDTACGDLESADPRSVSRGLTQSLFPPSQDASDSGPTTGQRMQLYEQHAGALGATAVRRALHASPVSADQVTHLITVSCTGFYAPGLDLSIIHECELNDSVARTHIGFMGCHGAINGLRVASSFAAADPNAHVLLCCVELCTLHQQYGWHPDRIVSNALFADGACAIVGSSRPLGTSPPQVIATGSTILQQTEELMHWRVRDHGFEMGLSPKVPEVIRDKLLSWLTVWLGGHQLSLDDIGGFAVHPGGPKILLACGDALGVGGAPLQASKSILSEYGNMSSPTVVFILERLIQNEVPRPYVMLAFGPGLSIEAALIA